MRRRRRHNPFSHPQAEEAVLLIKEIVKRSNRINKKRRNPWEPEWDQSIIPQHEEDPSNPHYTPVNIVLASLSPKIGREVLKLLVEDLDREENYRYSDMVDQLEEATDATYSLGEPIPEAWNTLKRLGRKQFTQLERFADAFGYDPDQVYSDFGATRPPRNRRGLRRKRRRRLRYQ